MPDYLQISIHERLEAFRRNDKKHLGGGWFDTRKKWRWIPQSLGASGCWDGCVFTVGGDACR